MAALELRYEHAPVYSLAAQQNSYQLFRSLSLVFPNTATEESGDAPRVAYGKLTLTLECEDGLIEPEIWNLSRIAPGQVVSLQDRPLRFSHEYLLSLSDEISLRFRFKIISGDDPKPLLEKSEIIAILPANHWGGEERQPELLAAFVKPNGVYVESIVKKVTDVLEAAGHGRCADGYQRNTREHPYYIAAATWGAICAQRLSYVTPPPSFAANGQLVRMPQDISSQRMGACLDLSLLFASCLELCGLNTVIALTKEHAIVGVWLIDTMFPLLTNDDPIDLRKRVDAGDMLLFESTMATNSQAPTFLQACSYGRSLVADGQESNFAYVIDVANARSRKVKPLATIEDRSEEVLADGEMQIELPPAPPLPPVHSDERVIEETAETRIDTWQRKLLDLTKRNPLLAFKERTTGIRIFCPDISSMEDLLAEDTLFSFVSSESSPIKDRDRSQETFRLVTGNNLHEEYAKEQLHKSQLIANMSEKRLANTALALFRKAKNDLQEGGANTLFMALGMLAWKEHQDSDRTFKAPLILVPVELTRRSAGAAIKLRRLRDEESLFNLTLIEFLYTEHGINLNHLREDLPEDDFGLDVAAIWREVRDAVAEEKGFEVVEECVVASFSFAKYLMWKDLKDRIDDLRNNPFVDHLVGRPKERYHQTTSFLDTHELDKKIDPGNIFLPLNCDASQMVAVEASSKPQDFVLEGPPGTGKSETIANIIANSIAKGRKVLFVAEKIAALKVVYSRMEKIGLGHLTLQLHSNKANKKAVLDQLRLASEKQEDYEESGWEQTAVELRKKREQLNRFVSELHTPSAFGISPRQAIARVAASDSTHPIRFDWGADLDSCPAADQEGFESILETAKVVAIAYSDVRDLDGSAFSCVNAVTWSYRWEEDFLGKVETYLAVAPSVQAASAGFAGQFGLSVPNPTTRQVIQLKALSSLTDIAMNESIGFAFGADASGRLDRLASLAQKKSQLDAMLLSMGYGATAKRLLETPVDQWVSGFEKSKKSWWKKLLFKRKINKLAQNMGYQKFTDLDILHTLKEAHVIAQAIQHESLEFVEYKLWKGWETTADALSTKEATGRKVLELSKRVCELTEVAAAVIAAIGSKLVDGRELLAESELPVEKLRFDACYPKIAQATRSLKELDAQINQRQSLADVQAQLSVIIRNNAKLKPWIEWMAARRTCEQQKLLVIVEALEAGRVTPDEIVECTHTAFCAWLAPRLIDSREALRTFKSGDHEAKLADFRLMDARLATTTGEYIAHLHAERAPDIKSEENAEHFGTLSRELQKKARHKPIRSLFEDMGERLLELCPCLMMSPLSIAQFLPSDFSSFDLVVFDEASQMTTWDSVGAIARGKNVIVVGDPKQMPPTNFFTKSSDPDDPDEEDLESILDQALAAGLPHLRLKGHYRSRHESLIAFSNSKYYENSLVTYPSCDTTASRVTLNRVNGVYAKGKGRNNVLEAKAVVDEVVRRLTDSRLREHSIGIVTLNTEQQRTIDDLLDDARRKKPEIERFFHEANGITPVWVKNLESVQGDQRDVIVLSIAYGPTEPGGQTMSMHFGALNRQGGERRLNVAITRATTEVMVFASFDHSMIDLSRSSAIAVEHLKHYLEFAEKGTVALAEQSTAAYGVDQFDSEFEEAVAWALRDRGWQVQTQVGVSKFRIDLGVVHPDAPGMYLAGVECDGATYHSSPNARDRDRTRQTVLENLGWRLVRLWSTDYFRDPEAAIEYVDDGLTELLQADREDAAKRAEEESNAAGKKTSVAEEPVLESYEDETQTLTAAPEYPANVFFDPEHEPNLVRIAKSILIERPCITIKALVFEIALRHGKSKTSKKQLELLYRLIVPWAGTLKLPDHPLVLWATTDEVSQVYGWRGLNPFGYDRVWTEIAYPEVLGLAQLALEQRPNNPCDFICEELALKRRAASTLATFRTWTSAIDSAELETQSMV